MRFGFTRHGAFVVVDDEKRIGEYVAPRSKLQRMAILDSADLVAGSLLVCYSFRNNARLRELRYRKACAELRTASDRPSMLALAVATYDRTVFVAHKRAARVWYSFARFLRTV